MKKILFIAFTGIYLTACSGSNAPKTETISNAQKQEVMELENEATVIEEKIHEVEASEDELNSALENL